MAAEGRLQALINAGALVFMRQVPILHATDRRAASLSDVRGDAGCR